jgi:glycosyltransferase involved in cell wall biosynthesis
MRSSLWHIAVLIPARNEERLLPRCLRSVQAARARLPGGITSDTILVSDCSQDGTTKIGQKMLATSGVVVQSEIGAVGAARALAAEIALQRFSGPLERCWLANTDADCEVPVDWLVDQLAIAARGFAAVAGIIDVDSFVEHRVGVRELFRLNYLINSDGSHPHVHGANLGVRADAYMRSGGWINLETAEDHDLWNRLRICGHQHLSDANLQVTTSGRRVGRAPCGFADALAAHNGRAA